LDRLGKGYKKEMENQTHVLLSFNTKQFIEHHLNMHLRALEDVANKMGDDLMNGSFLVFVMGVTF